MSHVMVTITIGSGALWTATVGAGGALVTIESSSHQDVLDCAMVVKSFFEERLSRSRSSTTETGRLLV